MRLILIGYRGTGKTTVARRVAELLELECFDADVELERLAGKSIKQIFADDVPSIVLFYPTYTYGVNQEIHGVQLPNLSNPSDRFRTVTDWYTLTREVIYSGSQFQDVKP